MMRVFIFLFLLLFNVNIFADIITVTILGSGTPRLDIDRFSQSILIEHKKDKFLFDAGRGSAIRLKQANILPSEINHVFFTHLHSDHILGFADIMMTGWIYQRKEQINIYGPLGTRNFVENTLQAYEEDIKIRSSAPENLDLNYLHTNIINLREGYKFIKNGLTIESFTVDHEPVAEAYGFKIYNEKYCLIISGDTRPTKNLINRAYDCNLLIHEIAHASHKIQEKYPKVKDIISYHTNIEQLSEIINTTKPDLTILNHVLSLDGSSDQDIENQINKLSNHKVIIAKDLMAIDLKDNIYIYTRDK